MSGNLEKVIINSRNSINMPEDIIKIVQNNIKPIVLKKCNVDAEINLIDLKNQKKKLKNNAQYIFFNN